MEMKLSEKLSRENNETYLLLIIIFLNFVFSGSDVVYSRIDFPEGFLFGSATSAFQWEGAVDEDGKTPSIWDGYAQSSKDIDCDGYHKYKEDVKLMYDVGLDAFRFSISWPRLIPNGRGPVNPKGLQFYKSLIAELTRHGIKPHVTLCHNDLPQALEDEYGGWIDRKIIDDFTAFADVCFREFGNEVKFWTTINEPNMMAMGSYDAGVMPPKHCYPPFGLSNCSRGNSSTEPYLVLHNMLLSHASTVRLYNQNYRAKQNGSIGILCFASWFIPFSSSKEDKIATQRAKDFLLGWILHPLVFGDYPEVMKKTTGNRMPSFTKEESELVKNAFDFVGVIHYVTWSIKHSSDTLPHFTSDMRASLIPIGNATLNQYDVRPWGLESVLEYIKQNYLNPPIHIVENGQVTNHYSSLHDVVRVEYIHAYIGCILKAIRNGSDTRGYFQWSFIDQYEFIDPNYTYGLYYVNFSDPKRKRTPKLSAFWYSAFLKGNNTTFLGSQGITLSNFSSSAY